MLSIIDLLFPKICVGCGGEGRWFCLECLDRVRDRTEPLGKTPDLLLETGLSGVFAAFSYDEPVIREAIQLLKYQGVWEVAQPLGELLALYLSSYLSVIDLACLPVPLHSSRQLERGFNQAELIAQQLPCRLLKNTIVRCRSGPPQASLDGQQRRANVSGVYMVRQPELLRGQDILIVDDVITTGSTVSEIARLAKTAGARSVWAAAVAQG